MPRLVKECIHTLMPHPYGPALVLAVWLQGLFFSIAPFFASQREQFYLKHVSSRLTEQNEQSKPSKMSKGSNFLSSGAFHLQTTRL